MLYVQYLIPSMTSGHVRHQARDGHGGTRPSSLPPPQHMVNELGQGPKPGHS